MVAPLKSARSFLPGTGKPVECPTCGRRLVDKRSLRQHAAAAHPVSADGVSPQHVDAEPIR